ncbi:hypothetical protein H2200_010758 [Cladophialophora chaetospira]|uniref:Uncharacterized protein n=1 Tax=Cladophialophora chaetospira TaxID=386627 RepID=A0AA38X0Q3_9EURO|nr:hypothetical protein H2200_010758 [Cladophialophora chaetospira]
MSQTKGLAWTVLRPHLTGRLETDFSSVDEILNVLKMRFGGYDGMAKELAEPIYNRLKQGKEERFEAFYERWLACADLLEDYHEQHLVEDFLQ